MSIISTSRAAYQRPFDVKPKKSNKQRRLINPVDAKTKEQLEEIILIAQRALSSGGHATLGIRLSKIALIVNKFNYPKI